MNSIPQISYFNNSVQILAPYAVFAFKFKNATVLHAQIRLFFLNKLHAEINIKLAFYMQTPS